MTDSLASIISGSFLDRFIPPRIRSYEYSVPELCGMGWRATFLLPPPPPSPPPPLRNGGKRNDSLECLFSDVNFILWFLFDQYLLPPPRSRGEGPPSPRYPIIHPVVTVVISSRASNYVEMVYLVNLSARFFPREKKFYQERGMLTFSTEYGGIWLLSETANNSHHAKNAFIASRRIYRAPFLVTRYEVA